MKKLFILFFLFIPAIIYAQYPINENSLGYCNGRRCMRGSNIPYTGIAIGDGVEYNYLNGLRDGPCKSIKNNSLQFTGFYKKNKRDSIWTYYEETRTGEQQRKREECHYCNDTLHGLYTAWYFKGNMKYKVNYIKGKKEGEWQEWYDNGNKKCIIKYKNDKLAELVKTYAYNGKEIPTEIYYTLQERYSDNKYKPGTIPDGYYISWDYDSTKTEGYYMYELKNGAFKEYYKNGKLKLSGIYSYGKKDGEFLIYHSNGQPESIDHYIKDTRDGNCKQYSRNGRLLSEYNYKNGKITSSSIYDEYEGYLKQQNFYKDGVQDSICLQAMKTADGKLSYNKGWYKNGKPVGTWECRDTSGNLINKTIWENNTSTVINKYGLYIFTGNNGLMGLKNEDGTVVVRPIYISIKSPNNYGYPQSAYAYKPYNSLNANIYLAQTNTGTGILTHSGKIIIDPDSTKIIQFQGLAYLIAQKQEGGKIKNYVYNFPKDSLFQLGFDFDSFRYPNYYYSPEATFITGKIKERYSFEFFCCFPIAIWNMLGDIAYIEWGGEDEPHDVCPHCTYHILDINGKEILTSKDSKYFNK
jgi:antitoxin component YwqK of YwqJK toxin-antitoxin module